MLKEKKENKNKKEYLFKYSENNKIIICLFCYLFYLSEDNTNPSSINESDFLTNKIYLNLEEKNKIIFKKIVFNINEIILIIKLNLTKGWPWTRIGTFEKVLLIFFVYYIMYDFDKVEWKNLIWYCINKSKLHCEPKAYKLLNYIMIKIYNYIKDEKSTSNKEKKII